MPGSAQDKNATLNGIKALYDAIQPYLNGGTHAGFTPVGSIIAIMGNEAPTHYLKCDGTVYNIVDYPDLAAYFEQQFEAKNFFGGDGIDTFAVPDLRGEFLRGTGTNSHTNQGSGENVGVHQDGSEITEVFSNSGGNIVIAYNGWTQGSNQDSITQQGVGYGSVSTNKTTTTSYASKKTVRPTNTSVLYCIATKNIFVDVTDFGEAVDAEDIAAIIAEEPPVARNNFQEYSLTERVVGRWVDGKPIYQKTISIGALPNNNEKTVATGISDLDLVIECIGFSYSSTVRRPLPYVYTNATLLNGVWVQQDNSVWNIHCRTGTDRTNENAYVTLKYTKTTD